MVQQYFPYCSEEGCDTDVPDRAQDHTRLLNDTRVARYGAAALNDDELLAMVLGRDGLASSVLREAGTLNRLGGFVEADFRRVKGVSRRKALQLIAAIELGRRTIQRESDEAPILNKAEMVAKYMLPFVVGLEVEKFWTLCLNRKNRMIKLVEITSGTATSTLAHPREVFRAAIRESASAVVVIHVHPSGDPAPSAADVQITHLLREAAKTVEISLTDHLIVGRAGADPLGQGFYSFREAGLL